MLLGEYVQKIYRKFTGEHPYRSVVSIKFQSSLIKITLQHGCSPVNLLHIFGTSFYKNNSGGLLLHLKMRRSFKKIVLMRNQQYRTESIYEYFFYI